MLRKRLRHEIGLCPLARVRLLLARAGLAHALRNRARASLALSLTRGPLIRLADAGANSLQARTNLGRGVPRPLENALPTGSRCAHVHALLGALRRSCPAVHARRSRSLRRCWRAETPDASRRACKPLDVASRPLRPHAVDQAAERTASPSPMGRARAARRCLRTSTRSSTCPASPPAT